MRLLLLHRTKLKTPHSLVKEALVAPSEIVIETLTGGGCGSSLSSSHSRLASVLCILQCTKGNAGASAHS